MSEVNASRLGAQIRAHRAAAGLTLEELAEASAISVRAISNVERGVSRNPHRHTIDALARGLALSDDDRAELARIASPPADRQDDIVIGGCALPRPLPHFMSRARELSLIQGVRSNPRDSAPVIVVSGQPGLGKTALAVRAAELSAERYPDGQLFVDLAGIDSAPMSAEDALDRLLRAIGTPLAQISNRLDERAGQWRAATADRRLLVVLDNAGDEAQIRPLLPGAGDTLVLVTSRQTLGGLEGVTRIMLEPMTRAESVALLRTITDSPFQPEDEAAEVARLCGYLPLALTIAANRLLSRPGWTMSYLADRLSDPARRLNTLTAGDLAVRTAFELSYAQLTEASKLVFRRLGLVPGTSFSGDLAAVLAGLDVDAAEDHLDRLTELNLLQLAPAPGRVRFHDLLRLFANERLAQDEPATAVQAVREQMMRWLLGTATAAGLWFDPDHTEHVVVDSNPDLATADAAKAWLQTERSSWLAAVRHASQAGWHTQVIDLAEAMHWYSENDPRWTGWIDVYQMAAHGARQLGNRRLEATHLNYLSWAVRVCGDRPAESAQLAIEAGALAEQIGDQRQQGWALKYAAGAYLMLDAPGQERAIAALNRSIECFESVGDEGGVIQARLGLGHALISAGRPAAATQMYRTVLSCLDKICLAHFVGRTTRAAVANALGRSLLRLGRFEEALAELNAGMPYVEGYGEPEFLGKTLLLVASAESQLGLVDDAQDHFHRALAIFEAVDLAELADQARAGLWQLFANAPASA